MPYQEYSDGLYLVMQNSQEKGVNHYGILDIGNRIQHPEVNNTHPVVIHQTPPKIQLSWLQDTGLWNILGKITDEAMAIERIKQASQSPNYSLFGHNCEHFARYVATGKKESTQIQAAVVIAGFAALTLAALR